MLSATPSFQGNRDQVIRKLGGGGKRIVFLCQDTVLARRVAIKLIKPALGRGLRNSAAGHDDDE